LSEDGKIVTLFGMMTPTIEDETLYTDAKSPDQAFSRLAAIIKLLRGPGGCPWDKKQTISSMAPQLLEETYEVIDGVKEEDLANTREELGDVYLVTTMMAQILSEDGLSSHTEILNEVCNKLIRRHPHVFSGATAENPEEVLKLWNDVKENVEGKKKPTSILASVKRSLPPLERAYKLQKKAAKVGFDWTNSHDVWKKIQEEFDELVEAYEEEHDQDHAEEELGDFLFSVINICRFLDIDPALALHRANQKFFSRFTYVEDKMKEAGYQLSKEYMAAMERFWNDAKTEGL
jgi:tetrapyrrole methylase family protein/MazG family protein